MLYANTATNLMKPEIIVKEKKHNSVLLSISFSVRG